MISVKEKIKKGQITGHPSILRAVTDIFSFSATTCIFILWNERKLKILHPNIFEVYGIPSSVLPEMTYPV